MDAPLEEAQLRLFLEKVGLHMHPFMGDDIQSLLLSTSILMHDE